VSQRPSAAFVIPRPYVDAQPCFREPIESLAAESWDIDLYSVLSPIHPAPFFGRENVRLTPIEMSRAGAAGLVARLVFHRPAYRCIITVPQWGLHYAGIAASLARVPLVCISDELTPECEAVSAEQQHWKRLERRDHQRCAFTIALSERRAEFIRGENRLGPDHPIYVVPNATPGPAIRLASRYYQDTLQIPDDKRVLLYAGSWWWKLQFAHLVDAAEAWGSRTVLVFQGRLPEHMAEFPRHPNLRVSPTVLPASLLNYATSSAHIGLALYDPARIGHREIGTASGKVALYLKNALPVIVSALPSLDWVEREGCGVCVNDVGEIGGAVDRICQNYERYVENAKRAYTSVLDFTKRFEPVRAKLLSQGARQSAS